MDIKSAADLKAAITLLEVDVSVKKTILAEQYQATCESLKPANLLRNTVEKAKEGLNEMFKTGNLAEKLIGAGVGFGAGFLSKKLMLGNSTNKFKRVLGTALELGITRLVYKNTENIKEKGLSLWKKITKNHNGQVED